MSSSTANHSSPAHGGYLHSSPPATSPQAPTEATFYTPEAARRLDRQASGLAAKHVFLDELDPNQPGYQSRYLHLDGLPIGTAIPYTEDVLPMLEDAFKHSKAVFFNRAVPLKIEARLPPSGMETHVFIKFDSALDATHAKCYLDHHGYPVSFVTPLVYAQAKYQDPTAVDPSEGQIYLLAETPDATKLTDPNTVLRACIDILQDIGLVRGIAQLSDGHPFMLRVEFDSVDAANRAVQILTRNTTWSTFEKDPLKVTVQCKPWSEVRSGTPAVPETLILNGSAFRNHGFDQHNRVRRERILDGSDIRTTVMLRNIPNKMDWLSLKQLIDQHCLGSYDFLYLRIDFSTGCNVGYAFVNFVDTSAMIALLDHIEFRTWKGFRSAKAAEVSYATIQGREALVAKFRNSSVMHETPYCRPRLLISCEDTTAVTRIGTEIDFPGADNAAKLHRSIDNARSMGLFPPHAAGSADRARYGMYDNGNPRDLFLNVSHLPPQVMRAVEVGYQCVNNFRHTPFGRIPRDFVARYLAVLRDNSMYGPNPAASVGVIGQPLLHDMPMAYPPPMWH